MVDRGSNRGQHPLGSVVGPLLRGLQAGERARVRGAGTSSAAVEAERHGPRSYFRLAPKRTLFQGIGVRRNVPIAAVSPFRIDH
jgi:hypothetical protein